MTGDTDGVLCSACGHTNRAGRRFCAECGAAFAVVCPACGGSNEPSDKFCGDCGAGLDDVAFRPASFTPSSLANAPTPEPSLGTEAPSSLLEGRYQLGRFLGEGAKKRVFLAHDTRLGREVAIAIIKTEGLDAAGRVRVRREAETMGKLGDHPNVVTVFDVAEDRGQIFLVSRFVAGGDLERRLREARDANERGLPLADVLRIGADTARALAYSHERGVVHRDVKPGNVWLDAEGRAQLGDFGLAVILDRSRLTQEGTMIGTVAYMPPEQALGRATDRRSDLYALGVMLYEMSTGRTPFEGDDAVGMIAQHINTPPVKPSWHDRKLPPAFDALVLRLLAKDPDARPADASEVADELDRIASISDGPPQPLEEAMPQTLPPQAGGRLVGRESELKLLQDALASALSGEGGVAMVVGEPGIGKTRLTTEFGVYTKLRGAQLLVGHCYDGEGSIPYLPFIEALRPYVREREEAALRVELGAGAPEIAMLLPEISLRLPDLPTAPSLEGEAERMRLFDSMALFMGRASLASPLVLVLDDLHWADTPSLLLLLSLARRIRGDRVLIVGTYRDVELERTHPLSKTVAALRGDGLYRRVLMRGLTRDGVRDLLSALSGQEPEPRFVDRMLEETEGNPFFVEEVLKHLIEVGALKRESGEWVGKDSVISRSIPEGVREVIGHRLSRLSDSCNALLTRAAAMPAGFSFQVLSVLSEEGEDSLLDLLDEALRAQLIRERGHGERGTYEFSHALIRQTLYQELSTPRQIRLHRQIAEALEEVYRGNLEAHLSELAFHYFQGAPGGDVDKAIDLSKRAARHALSLFAYEEAGSHYEHALEALEMKEPSSDLERFDLLLLLADVKRLAGDRAQCRKIALPALEIARRSGDDEKIARATLVYATEDVIVPFDPEDMTGILEEALRAGAATGAAMGARLLLRLVGNLVFKDPARAAKLAHEAVALARRIGTPDLLCRALVLASVVSPEFENEDRLSTTREILSLAERGGRPDLIANARYGFMRVHLDTGDIESFDRELVAYEKLAAEIRQPVQISVGALHRAMRGLLRGPFDRAKELVEEAWKLGRQGDQITAEFFHLLFNSNIEAETGSGADSSQKLVDFYASPLGANIAIGSSSAMSLFRLGRTEDARAAYLSSANVEFSDVPNDVSWLARMVMAADACCALGYREHAPGLLLALSRFAGLVPVIGPMAICFAPVTYYLARLEALQEHWGEAFGHFEAAIEKLSRLGARPYLAHTHFHFANALSKRDAPGDRDRALQHVNAGLDIAQPLGMKPLIEHLLERRFELQGIGDLNVKESVFVVASAVEKERPDLGRHAAPDGTVTLLFSDMEGFTAMTERLGDLGAREVIRAHNRVVREQVAAHGGFEVELQGDGFLLAFGSARQGLLCAVDIQRAFKTYSENAEEPIRVRIGVHTGEALRDADKFFGKTVILAARIAGEASGGEILVSSLVRDLTASTGDVYFGEERSAKLKGLSETQRLVCVEW